ncbi:MAG: serine/threonine-protein kinase [Atopobiaceae bacterium]|jgi:serine/threonine protein kinase|nr:serine/threonine protein kinase [Atopobiaceae bacterium]MDD2588866.1 serine/threonine-protein kinase [Atopobiaceae bacterium]MDD4381372.1 serine/threonine-protein kinase [Atopobiaceae bacterium]
MTVDRSDADLLHALELDDAYRVERVLGEGPSARTELVALEGSGPFVRKRIPLELANPAAWARLMTIDEPLLPKVERTYTLPDAFVVVSDYVDGMSLDERVRREGPLVPNEAIRILEDVAHAAGVLHAHGIIHRDITPANVVLAADGAHLIDLGIARVHSQEEKKDTTRMGTWGFAAPEQFGFAQTDARSDVYSLGRLLAYMLVGVRPDAVGFEASLADPARVSATLAHVVAHACAFEPSARPQTADELVREADAALAGEVVADKASSSQMRPALATPRRVLAMFTTWRPWAAVAIVLAAATFGLGFFESEVVEAQRASTIVMRVYSIYFGAVLVMSMTVVPAWELSRAVLCAGPYKEKEGRWKHAIWRVARSVLVGVALITVVAVLIALVKRAMGV